MLRKFTPLLESLFELILTVIIWALSLIIYKMYVRSSDSQTNLLAMLDIKIAFGLSFTFMLLSAYPVSVVAYHYWCRQNNIVLRVFSSASIFVVHAGIFLVLVGTSLPGRRDWLWVLIGVIGVLLASETAHGYWRERR